MTAGPIEPMTIVVSWSELKSFRDCPMKHWLAYRMRQEGKPDSHASTVGKIWHSMQQDWYQGRIDQTPIPELQTTIAGTHLSWRAESEKEADILSTLLWMWDGFLEAGDPFADCTVLATEYKVEIPLPPAPGQPDHVSFVLKVIIDLIMQRGNKVIVVDHKSQAKAGNPDNMSRDMDVDDQLGLYLFAIRHLYELRAGQASCCWSYAITTELKKTPRTLDERYWLVWSARTDAELDAIGREASDTAMDAYRRPLALEPPRHPDKENCRWRCDHREPCFYARAANRPVYLTEPYKADQAPDGITREET